MTVSVSRRKFPHLDLRDYAYWQDALDALNSAGGGKAIAPEGTHDEALTIYDNVHLEGQGPGATILRLASGSSAGTNVIKTYNYASLAGTTGTGGPSQWSVSRMSIDGNKSNNASGGSGIAIFGRQFRLHDLNIRNCKSDGIRSEWASASAGLVGIESMEADVIGLQVHHNDGHGISWNGPHDSQFVNVVSYKNESYGFYIQSKAPGCQLVNCHGWGTPQDWAFWIEAPSALLASCFGESSDTGQLMIAANSCIVIGGRYFMSAATARTGIRIGNGSSITGCSIDTVIANCETAALNFANDGGSNRVRVKIEQDAGTVTTGSISAGTMFEPYVVGSVSYTYNGQMPVPIAIRSATSSAFSVNDTTNGKIVNIRGDNPNQRLETAYGADIIAWSDGFSTKKFQVDGSTGDTLIGGALDHDGSTVGFFGVTPVTRPTTYSASNVTTDRTYDANATTLDEVADVLGTLIADLRTMGLVT